MLMQKKVAVLKVFCPRIAQIFPSALCFSHFQVITISKRSVVCRNNKTSPSFTTRGSQQTKLKHEFVCMIITIT